MDQYLINNEGLKNLFETLKSKGKKITAPVLRNNKPAFAPVSDYSEIASGFVQTVNSAKETVFPRTEKVFGYQKKADGMSVQNFNPDDIPETVLWGIRPCDAAALGSLDAVFNWDYKDIIFNTRLSKTTVISFSCATADENCFCTSVNGGPGNTAYCDIQLTQLGATEDYLAEILTEKGKAIYDLLPSVFSKTQGVNKTEYLADVPVKFSHTELSAKLADLFESKHWKEQAMRCLGCGACAYVCPVCSCFDIQDEVHGKCGERLRCWDSCGFSLFTLHTSGHNPRDHQSQRWRQRMLHKFSYMPERLSVYGCTGCGRCSRACPADINIFENIISIGEVKQ
ncbi:MAG TPA: 4Fe-4S dicluster domain-containing protein [Bacteroidales bacterium]|nr:4Fe-4S dicluster domain-containing protein [Bacteroidales bacterium]